MGSLGSGNILIVGGCGTLGRHIALDLIKNYNISPHDIHVFDKSVSGRDDITGVVFHEGDITVRGDVANAIKAIRPKTVFDVASPKPFVHDLGFFIKVNVEGTRNIVEMAEEVGTVHAFVYTSSSSVVHDAVSDLHFVDESAPVLFMPQQREPYHHSKALAEKLVLESNNRASSGMRTVALRPSGIFGKGDTTTVIPLIQNAKAGKYRFQIGDGSNLFDWTYVENVARAHILAAEALIRTFNDPSSIEPGMEVDGEAFFVTNDEPVPFWDFVRSVGAAAGYPTPADEISVIPKRIGLLMATVFEWATWAFSLGMKKSSFTWRGVNYSTQVRTFNIDKAKKRLGYRPFIGIKEGIQSSVEGGPY